MLHLLLHPTRDRVIALDLDDDTGAKLQHKTADWYQLTVPHPLGIPDREMFQAKDDRRAVIEGNKRLAAILKERQEPQ